MSDLLGWRFLDGYILYFRGGVSCHILYFAKPRHCPCLAVFSFPDYATVIKRPMDLQTMFYKVKLGAFGGLHPDDPAIASPSSFEERKPPGPLVGPSGLSNVSESQESQRDRHHHPMESAGSASESANALPIANGDGPVFSAVAPLNSGGSDAVGAFWSSVVIEGVGENSPVASASTGGNGVGYFGSSDKDFGPNGVDVARETMTVKVGAGENEIPEVNGVPRDVTVGTDGIDQVCGNEGAGTAGSYSGVGGLSGESIRESSSTAAHRGAEEGSVTAAGGAGTVVAAAALGGGPEDRAVWPPVAFETATAPFDYVAFFRDMKLVSLASGEALMCVLTGSCCILGTRYTRSVQKVCADKHVTLRDCLRFQYDFPLWIP